MNNDNGKGMTIMWYPYLGNSYVGGSSINTWSSSNAHPNVSNADCIMQNSPTWNASITGGDGTMGYWNFNGSSQYTQCGDILSLTAYTKSAWFSLRFCLEIKCS